jgi:hypothetical protein
MAGDRGSPQRPGNEHRRPQPGGLAGELGIPRGCAQPVLLGAPDQVPDLDGPPRGATAQRPRRRAPLAGRTRAQHRQGGRNRVLHGRRLRADDGPPPRVLCGERQLRRRHRGCRACSTRCVPDRRLLRRQGSMAGYYARFPIVSSRCSPGRASSTRSRCIPTRDTAFSTITTPRSCLSGSRGSRSLWRPSTTNHRPVTRGGGSLIASTLHLQR